MQMKFLGGGSDQRAPQQHLGQKAAQTHQRVDGRGHQRGRQRIDLGHHHHMQVLSFLVDVGRALHQHGGIHALHLHIVGPGNAPADGHVPPHEVKREAVAEHIAEVQRQTSGQRLQAEHAQQLGQTRLCLQKLAFLHIQMQCAAQRLEIRRHRRACPADVALHAAPAIRHDAGHLETVQQLAHITQIQLKLQLCLAWVLVVGRADAPRALGCEHGLRRGDIEARQLPLTQTRPGRQPAVARLHIHTAQRALAQLEVLHADLQRGQFPHRAVRGSRGVVQAVVGAIGHGQP